MGNAGADGVVRCCRTDDGTEIWNSHPLGALRNAPVVIDGRVFVGTAPGTVGVLDARSGTLVRTIELGGEANPSPSPILMPSSWWTSSDLCRRWCRSMRINEAHQFISKFV